MGKFVRHESCPSCGSRDNLARYEDGSAWCFGCRYKEPPTRSKAQKVAKAVSKAPWTTVATLPPTYIDQLVVRGLNEAERALFTYSPELDRIVYTIGDFSEARSFTKQPKTLSFGTKPFHIVGEGDTIVLVEDVFSSLRVGRVTASVALFGAIVPKDWMLLLSKITKRVILWLDEDKYGEAVKQARTMRLLGIDTVVVHTKLDPKEYSPAEIEEILLIAKGLDR